MSQLTVYLEQFRPISLDEMDSVKLLNRTDKKYIFSYTLLPEFLQKLSANYKILEINKLRDFRYMSVYFDTKSLNMYYAHHNGQLNRYKIRHRTYVDSGSGFLEIKLKNNKSRTVKERIPIPYSFPFKKESESFLNSSSPYSPETLNPIIQNEFNRITLVDEVNHERITIDHDISFVKTNGGSSVSIPHLIICEIKQNRYNSSSDIVSVLNQLGIKQCSISKYCIGSVLLNQDLKANCFKDKLRIIEKIKNF